MDGNQDIGKTRSDQPEHLLEAHSVLDSTTDSAHVQTPQKPSLFHRVNKKFAIAGLAVLVIVGAAATYALTANDTPKTQEMQSQSQPAEVIRFGVAVGLAEGKVEYSTDRNEWASLETTVELEEGMYVRTGGDGRVVLLVDDGSAIRLSYSSEIELKSLSVEDVRVNNLAGEVYTRVVPDEDRRFSVYVEGDLYEAKGTAYRTVNKEAKKGVEVYHSSVEAMNKDTVISEGNAYFTLLEQKDKENVISPLDLEALKADEFIKWNAAKDKEVTEFADKLGVLVDIDKVTTLPPPPPPAPKPAATAGIVLKASASDYEAVFSWTVNGVDVSSGYKLVRSSKTTKPVYPDNSVAFIKAGKTSYTHYDSDGGTYSYRICAYRDGSCDSYSNAVSVTTKKKEKPVVEVGAVNLTISGNVASWTYAGTAPHGFKLVASTTSGPTYPGADHKKYTDGTSTEIMDGLTGGATYYVRVCKYTGEGCQDYSNELTYIAP